MMHHIRKSILDLLATADHLRYGQLKPDDLDGNVFNYHLKGLITDKLVEKNEAGEYALTHRGRDYIVHRYEDPAYSAHSIFLIVLQRGQEYLLRRRLVQPLLGYTGFIHGEPVAGQEILETAKQRLLDKTGLRSLDLSVVGSGLIAQYRNDELQSYSHAVILYGETSSEIATEEDATGQNFWSSLDGVDNLLPSCTDIVRMIENKQSWLEASYELSQMDV